MDFNKVYIPPFSTDDIGLYVKSSNGVKAFTIAANNPKEEADNLVALLNGTGGNKYKDIMIYGGCKLVTSNASVFVTRGFGYLLGIENLSVEEAVQTQDDFIKWIIEKIKE